MSWGSWAIKTSIRAHKLHHDAQKAKPMSIWNFQVLQLSICTLRGWWNIEADTPTQNGPPGLKLQQTIRIQMRLREHESPPVASKITRPKGSPNTDLARPLQTFKPPTIWLPRPRQCITPKFPTSPRMGQGPRKIFHTTSLIWTRKRNNQRKFTDARAFQSYVKRKNYRLRWLHTIMHMSTSLAPDIDRRIEETRRTPFTKFQA